MIKLLGASALALTLSMPAAHAAHRYRHVTRMAYRHHGYGVRHLAWDRTGWRRGAASRRYGMRDASFGESYAEAGWRDDARYERRSTGFRPTELHAGGSDNGRAPGAAGMRASSSARIPVRPSISRATGPIGGMRRARASASWWYGRIMSA